MKTFRDIISAWPGVDFLAVDIGVGVETVRGWWKRDSIPVKHWKRLLDKAPERNISISPDLLIDLAARN